MERTIRIANTKTQQRYVIQTSATTLGELQDQMTAQGIDFSGMSFTEGLSKTHLISRDTMLPTNVPYKGQRTNDLIMLLTNTTKNIALGAISRKEAYQMIKQYNLQDAIAEGEGQNYTRCKTDVLENYINEYENAVDPTATDEEEEVKTEVPSASPEVNVKTAPHPNTVNWLYDGIKAMVNESSLYTDDVVVLADLVNELAKRLVESELVLTDDDVDDVLASI